MLAAFKILRSKGLAKALLVIAPLRVCYTSWPNEVRKWSDFEDLSVGILHGPKKERVLREEHDVYLINYEAINWLFDVELPKLRGKWPFDVLVADESTKLKHTDTKRFKALREKLNRFRRRYIMTGSPMPNGLIDLFGQCFVMDRGVTLGKFITHYRNEYFYPKSEPTSPWLPLPDSADRIYNLLVDKVYYAHDKDYLNLPPVMESFVEVDLPPKARKLYDQMESSLFIQLEKGQVNAVNTGVASMKCRQIANGGVYIDGMGERQWEHIHEAKVDAVADILEELGGQPALVTYDFHHDLDRLKKRFGEKVPHIGKGGVKPKDLPALIKRWNQGELPYIFVSPASLSHGVDGLQHGGKAVVWASLTYNYEDEEQLNHRLVRSGQEERVSIIRVIARQTIDEAVISSLRRKERNQNTFFDALKEYWNGKTRS